MKVFGILGALGLFVGVALGAFAAHALRGQLSEQMQSAFETGIRYQMYHSIVLLIVSLLSERSPFFQYAGIAYVAGIVLFSGSLYALAISGIRILGTITPIGGLCFLAGHILLIFGFWRLR